LVYAVFVVVLLASFGVSLLFGSVPVSARDCIAALRGAITGVKPAGSSVYIASLRIPRALTAGLVGATLSLTGAAMQGLLKNPLADGSTLGVSSGASLGAVIAIITRVSIPGLPFSGTTVLASCGAFLSLLLILSLAYRLDGSLSTNTIILVGVIFSMFASSVIQILVTFAGHRARDIMFWTMGSLSGKGRGDVLLMLFAFAVFGGVLFSLSRELNAFAVGEDNARAVGVNVRRVKLAVLICVSALIGISVSVAGTVAFVGLVTPHMVRMVTGPNHRRLMPASAIAGASFLMLCDLISRTVLNPRELPIGVVTSLIGAVVFIYIFYAARRRGQ
jgi:iron complex transport system permease protein